MWSPWNGVGGCKAGLHSAGALHSAGTVQPGRSKSLNSRAILLPTITLPYWLCKICHERLGAWSGAREHIYTVHNVEVMRLLGESMIPEMMLLEKHLGES